MAEIKIDGKFRQKLLDRMAEVRKMPKLYVIDAGPCNSETGGCRLDTFYIVKTGAALYTVTDEYGRRMLRFRITSPNVSKDPHKAIAAFRKVATIVRDNHVRAIAKLDDYIEQVNKEYEAWKAENPPEV